MPIASTVLYPVIPFINVTEIRTLRSSSLNAHILGALLLWVFSFKYKACRQGKQLKKLASKGGVRKTRSGYLRMADADGKMSIEKIVNNNKNKT